MPRGVKGSGKTAAKTAARGGGSSVAPARAARDGDEQEFALPAPSNDRVPRCRVNGCGAMLTPGGDCPACAFRARKYSKLFAIQNPNCECGAPRQPKKAGATRMPKRCPCCSKLHARAKSKGIEV